MSKILFDTKKLNEKLSNGGVIAFVTDTVWGLGARPDNKKGVEKIYEIKGRDRTKPLILMSNDVNNLYPYVKNVSKTAQEFIERYFPGALTIVTEKSELTPGYITAGKDTVGIRVPDNKFFSELCSNIQGGVLATTSANLSGEKSSKTFEETKNSIGKFVDIVFEDYGYCCKGLESTVISVIDEKITLLRQGSMVI